LGAHTVFFPPVAHDAGFVAARRDHA
jgi:hypothetical protein